MPFIHCNMWQRLSLPDSPSRSGMDTEQSIALQPVPSARSLAQRRRRERERTSHSATTRSAHVLTPQPVSNARSVAQRRRRERERIEGTGRTHRGTTTPHLTTSSRQSGRRPARRASLFLAARRPYEDPIARHDLGSMDVTCSHCGASHWLLERRSGSSKQDPQFGSCCNGGKVILAALREPPPALRALFVAQDVQAKEFQSNIREYNSALSFTSLGVKPDGAVLEGGGPYVFRLHGVLYHLSGSLLPEPGNVPIYSQLYIHDPRSALKHRLKKNPSRRADTMEVLQKLLNDNHRYVAIYKQAHEILAEYPDADNASIRLRVDPSRDQRRYNLPTSDEVAIIIPGDGEQATDGRDIILRNHQNSLQRVSDGHSAYDCLRYVLLFPYGEHGWHYDVQSLSSGNQPASRKVSQSRYYAYRFHSRPNEFSTILRGGRLFQEFLVDKFAGIDQSRLRYLRLNQDKIRATLYSGLEDAINTADETVDLNQLGRRIILPSSYIGGARHMHQRFQDAMAIVRYFRKVDLFVTVTANPKSPEIQRELLLGQTASDRPDLVARVFKMKKEAIINDIFKEGIFGRAASYVYTIEFQKRGLPHMHILIILKPPHKLLAPVDVDSVIRAYWPDPETEPLLFDTVKRLMVHGPCGAFNPKAPCMENGKCTKGFPKAFQEFTTMDEDGYPKYLRPNDGRAYLVNKHMIDNRWIVPYNPYMSTKYDSHINAECVASVGAIKYPFKYIHKGGDRASIELHRHDEITEYIDGRYVSPPEGAWRIFHFDMHDQLPNVVRLQIHLPGQHMVAFNPNWNAASVLEQASTEKTSLTAFFDANSNSGALGAVARRLTYQEFPQEMVLKGSGSTLHWGLRQQGFALGRMYFASPSAGERFYLRMLLTVVKGPRSFEELRTVDGVIHPTFRDACLARGLLENDGEWRQCLLEASIMHTGSRLRYLFATILLFCSPSQPEILWEEFRQNVCDDLLHRLRTIGIENPTQEDAHDYGLYLLDQILQQSGQSLKGNFPSMPTSVGNWHGRTENQLILEQLDYNHQQESEMATAREMSLNPEQREAYDKIIHSVRSHQGSLFFLNGPGGTGKTFIYNVVCHRLRGDGLIVLCVASSGIAAQLLAGGRTAHSMFKIPIDGLTNESMCNVPKEGLLAKLLRRVNLIIWDEITMQDRHAFEAVDRTLRDIIDSDHPFGGITVVFGGDYQQILPVVVKATREETIEASLQRSYLWKMIKILRLERNMRLENGASPGEREFAKWLLDIGHGRCQATDGTVHLREDMRAETASSLIDFIYPGVGSNPPPPSDYFLRRMILAPRNGDVDSINEEVLSRMSGDAATYYSADAIVTEVGADGPDAIEENLPVEVLRSLSASGLPSGELTLKPGCPLILLRNLAPARGLCNGARMTLLRMSERVLEVKLIGGDHDGDVAFIPRVSLTPSGGINGFSFLLRRRQFPVRLAFALTINKAQGQSADFVGLDLRVPVFAHGQLYVAFSRATSSQRIKVLLPDTESESITYNVVYPEVLLD